MLGEQIDVVRQAAPIVSFTFGIPDAPSLDALRKAGSILVQTGTSAEEALMATKAGVDSEITIQRGPKFVKNKAQTGRSSGDHMQSIGRRPTESWDCRAQVDR